jgi:hypothetical protein
MRHHQPVPSLHVDPAVVRDTAATVEALIPALRVPGLDRDTLDALARVPGGAVLVAEHDRIAAAVTRTRRAMAEVVAGLGAVAADVDAAERAAVRAMQVVDL